MIGTPALCVHFRAAKTIPAKPRSADCLRCSGSPRVLRPATPCLPLLWPRRAATSWVDNEPIRRKSHSPRDMSHQKIVGLEGTQSVYTLRAGRILDVLVRLVHGLVGLRLGIRLRIQRLDGLAEAH